MSEKGLRSKVALAVLLSSAVISALASVLIVSALTRHIWVAPVNAFGWHAKSQDPREMILGLQVLSLRYFCFRLFFLTLVCCAVALVGKTRELGALTLRDLARYSGLSGLLAAAHGVSLGVLAERFWWARSQPNVSFNYQAIFVYDIYFTIMNAAIDIVFSVLSIVLMSIYIAQFKRASIKSDRRI